VQFIAKIIANSNDIERGHTDTCLKFAAGVASIVHQANDA